MVMTHELAYDPSQMPLVEGDQEVEALAANRPDEPLAYNTRIDAVTETMKPHATMPLAWLRTKLAQR